MELHGLSDEEIVNLVQRALGDERGLGGRYKLDDRARDAILLLAGGDGRAALTTLELAAGMVEPGTAKKPAKITDTAGHPHRSPLLQTRTRTCTTTSSRYHRGPCAEVIRTPPCTGSPA